MNRVEYLKQFKKNLIHMSNSEKEDVLRYYEEYFDEAGSENEQKVIEDLGNPVMLARKISAECAIKEIAPEVVSDKMPDEASDKMSYEESDKIPDEMSGKDVYETQLKKQYRKSNSRNAVESKSEKKLTKGLWSSILVIVMAICSVPVLLPVSMVITVVAFVILLIVAVLLFVVVVVGVLLCVAGIVSVIGGIIGVFVHFFSGLTAVGVGFVIAGAGMLLFIAGKWLAKATISLIVELGRRKTSRM